MAASAPQPERGPYEALPVQAPYAQQQPPYPPQGYAQPTFAAMPPGAAPQQPAAYVVLAPAPPPVSPLC
jgi:hypothetical protein